VKPDFIIVGAGTAGCLLTARLSAQGMKVLLLEAGGPGKPVHSTIPAAFAKLFDSKHDWAYRTGPQQQLNGRRIFWPRGKMLGGSSAMNAQIHQWCSASDFEAWGDGWNYGDLEPSLKRVSVELSGGKLRDPNPLTHAFLKSAQAAGLPTSESYNGGVLQPGAWLCEVAHRNGARWSAADAYLASARARGASIMADACVGRVRFDGARAVGVDLARNGSRLMLDAERGVILCAGAVNSPGLLLASGIGPASALDARGVSVVVDSPEVGANLQDHLMFVMHFRCKRPISLKSAESPANMLRYLMMRRGMLASNVAEAIAFAASAEGGSVDLEIVFAPVLFQNEGLSPPSVHGFSLGVVLLSPRSRGRVTLSEAGGVQIDPGYLSDAGGEDLKRLIAGARLGMRIANAAPLTSENAGMMSPAGLEDGAIESAIRAEAHTIYHPVGTCRMGDDARAVVDRRLKVRGAERLWVADASVMPTIPSGHPNAVVSAIADRAANLIQAR
jgi:choline dehydrogenase